MMLFSLLTIGQSAHSQKSSSGIYKTAEDFQQKKLSYAIDCDLEKHKISTNIYFDGYEWSHDEQRPWKCGYHNN